MNKGGGDENTGAKVLAREEDLLRDLQPLDPLRYHGKAGSKDGGSEDED